MLAQEMVNLKKNSIQVLKENLKDVQRLYATGSVPKFELLQAEVQYRNQETSLLEAEYNYRLALDMFNYQLGFDMIKYDIDRSTVDQTNIRTPAGDDAVEKLVDQSIRNRPEILQVAAQKEMTEHSKKTYQSTYIWPTFSVIGGYGKTYLLPNQVDAGLGSGPIQPDFSQLTGKREWQDTWQVRIAATYRWGSLFPVDSNRAAEREQEEKLLEVGERLSQIKRLSSISIRSNFAKLKTSHEAILSQRKNVETAEEGLRIARESYNAGIIKNTELLGAELLVTQSRTGLIKSVYDYYLSRAALNKEVGIDINSIIFQEAKSE
jgi:outer membrane protein TolC